MGKNIRQEYLEPVQWRHWNSVTAAYVMEFLDIHLLLLDLRSGKLRRITSVSLSPSMLG